MQWGDNVTFVRTVYDTRSRIVRELSAQQDKLPVCALVLRELSEPIPLSDELSATTIIDFLRLQVNGFRVSTLHKSPKRFTPDALAEYAAARPHGSIVLALCQSVKQEQEVTLAARRANVHLYLRAANETVAQTLGAPFPSVLVVHGRSSATVSPLARWPLFKPTHDHGVVYWVGLDVFFTERALPPLMPLGASDGRFRASLKRARAQMTVYLVHNQRGRWAAAEPPDPEAIRTVSRESTRAMAAVRHAAPHFAGVVSFIALDWFDNPFPEMARELLPASGSQTLSDARLPVLFAVRGRFGRHGNEKGAGKQARHGGTEAVPWASKLMRGAQLSDSDAVRTFVSKAVADAGVLATPPPDHATWSPPRAEQSSLKHEL